MKEKLPLHETFTIARRFPHIFTKMKSVFLHVLINTTSVSLIEIKINNQIYRFFSPFFLVANAYSLK